MKGSGKMSQIPLTYAVTSGKGGVGKTNIVLNLSIALVEAGRKVLILDADLGLGNLDVLLGIQPNFTMGDLLSRRCTLKEALIQGPKGVKILPADSGVADYTRLNTGEKMKVFSLFQQFSGEADTILIDTASGISSDVQFFSSFANQVLLIATPEPTSITDAYATMKVLARKTGERNFQIMINLVESESQGREIYQTLRSAAERFLKIVPDYVGCIMKDSNLTRAVLRQKPFLELYPGSTASENIRSLAMTLIHQCRANSDAEKEGSLSGSPPELPRNGVMVH